MLHVDGSLTRDAFVCRYLSFESFVAFVESRVTVLTNINRWDDQWEAILSKVLTVNDKGEETPPGYSFHQDIFGQSWTSLHESDAMWRIYSPTGTGVQLKTTVSNFELIGGVRRAHIGTIFYFRDIPELLAAIERPLKSPFAEAMVKRAAFDHEKEVRYLTNGQFLANRVGIHDPFITLPLDPVAFIEGVTVDPRAPDWYLEAVSRYAKRAGLRCTPTRSTLYEPNPHTRIGVRRTWVTVNSDPEN